MHVFMTQRTTRPGPTNCPRDYLEIHLLLCEITVMREDRICKANALYKTQEQRNSTTCEELLFTLRKALEYPLHSPIFPLASLPIERVGTSFLKSCEKGNVRFFQEPFRQKGGLSVFCVLRV